MSSFENDRTRLITDVNLQTRRSYTESPVEHEDASTTICFDSNSKDHNQLEFQSAKTKNVINLSEVSGRLTKRKFIYKKCAFFNDIICFIGLLGIVLMIVDNEIKFKSITPVQNNINFLLEATITISTILLILLLIYYHYLTLKLYCINNCIENLSVALTKSRLIQIVIEILICAIHPVPLSFAVKKNWSIGSEAFNVTSAASSPVPLSTISVDVALGLPMFARVYLICRCITYHSCFRDSSTRSLGYLNRVPIDFFFVIKANLEKSPTTSLAIFFLFMLFIGSWSLRACNYTINHEHLPVLNAMWLFLTLFTSVGYGDIIPSTYCGRGVATLTAFIGVMTTAFLIALVSQNLIFNRWEKYIYNFVLNIELAKAHQSNCANIIKFAWKIWKLKKIKKTQSIEYVNHQRKLFQSILKIQEIKENRRQLADNIIGIAELMILNRDTNSKTIDSHTKIDSIDSKFNQIETRLEQLNQQYENLNSKLNLLINKLN